MLLLGLLALAMPPSAKAQRNSSNTPTKSVVAQGVGATTDEALKDAFREAVREVVGMFVDAKTQVKNDQLIEDKVLTYSNAYIQSYEKIGMSNKDGIVRLKIKAEVKREPVVEKLKSERISVKQMDGQGLFAKAITQADRSASAESLLAEAMKGFPLDVVTAQVTKPVRNSGQQDDEVTVEFDVDFNIDMDAYRSFAIRLIERLDEVTSQKGEFTASFEQRTAKYRSSIGQAFQTTPYYVPEGGYYHRALWKWMREGLSGSENLPEPLPDRLTIIISGDRTNRGDRMESRYFVLDPEIGKPILDAAMRATKIKAQFVDESGDVVLTERFDAAQDIKGLGTLGGSPSTLFGERHSSRFYILDVEGLRKYDRAGIVWLHPGFTQAGSNRMNLSTSLSITREVKFTIDELKTVAQIRCEVYQ